MVKLKGTLKALQSNAFKVPFGLDLSAKCRKHN